MSQDLPCYNCDGEGRIPSDQFLYYKETGYHVETAKKIEMGKDIDYDIPREECKICNGEGTLFYINGEEEYFRRLLKKYSEETGMMSYLVTNHPSYKKMKLMKSKKAVIYCLKILEDNEDISKAYGIDAIYRLLFEWIPSKHNPINKEMRGKIQIMRDTFVEWGKEKKLI